MQRQVAIAVTIVLVVLAAVWLWMGRGEPDGPPPDPVPAFETPPASEPGTGELPAALPPLDASDTLLRDELFALGLSEPLAILLEQQDIVRTLVAATNAIAAGRSPRQQLPFLEPEGYFDAEREGGALYIDPESYRRYDALTAAATAIEPTAAARGYLRLEPLFDRAYAELGMPGPFRERMSAAIDHLLDAPILSGRVELEDAINRYRFADPALESLTEAQKHLLRAGPGNQERLQSWIRAFRDALNASA